MDGNKCEVPQQEDEIQRIITRLGQKSDVVRQLIVKIARLRLRHFGQGAAKEATPDTPPPCGEFPALCQAVTELEGLVGEAVSEFENYEESWDGGV